MHPTTIRIREATDADLGAITDLLNEQIATSPYVYAETLITIEDRRTWLNTHQVAGLPVLVATLDDDGRIAGWASLSPYRSSSGYRFTVEASVYVAPSAQRRGIATQLLRELIARAQRLELNVIVASIDADNAPSVALFERFGFAECARLPDVGRKFDAWRTQLLFIRRVEQ